MDPKRDAREGRFGQVYLGLNVTNGELLAVKQFKLPQIWTDRKDDPKNKVVESLKANIISMKELKHANIVHYLGLSETKLFLHVFLEYVPGGSIGRCIRKHGALELSVIKSFTSQILEGLKYLHSFDIFHRDLKPDNILVDLAGNCKISGYDISKRSENVYEEKIRTSLQGRLVWIAPEFVSNPHQQGYTAKVDIWSLGCVVLEMFVGRRPWSDAEAIRAMFNLGAESLRPQVPEDIVLTRMSDHFIAACFVVDPEHRPTADRLTDHRFLEMDRDWRFEESELHGAIKTPES